MQLCCPWQAGSARELKAREGFRPRAGGRGGCVNTPALSSQGRCRACSTLSPHKGCTAVAHMVSCLVGHFYLLPSLLWINFSVPYLSSWAHLPNKLLNPESASGRTHLRCLLNSSMISGIIDGMSRLGTSTILAKHDPTLSSPFLF